MDMDALNLKIVLILTIGFGFASILGYIAFRAKLSPILGYLIAGFLIGPYSPGYIADIHISEELAEIGVVLMLFGVGLHFKLQDLLNTSRIAIPGAIGQTLVATLAGVSLVHFMGWSLEAGIIFGLSIGVASTVVLVRVLSDNGLLHTPEGHIAVGWLIVEDIITVIALLLLPLLAATSGGDNFPILDMLGSFSFILLKFVLLTWFMFTIGRKIVSYILAKVMLTNSHELFTLTILAITFVIAAGSALLLGTSIALGAFIAGMMVGQTGMRHQVSLNAMPIKDAFVVVFFLSIGMLFNPFAITSNLVLFGSVLAIIMILKPLTAYCIAIGLKYSHKTALTISLALAQIGEFSFILSEEAMKLDLLPDEGYDVIVACAIVSISINPLLFKYLKKTTEIRSENALKAISNKPSSKELDMHNLLKRTQLKV